MALSLNNLSGSELRRLTIAELREFIVLLDSGTTEDLQKQKELLKEIFACISSKEQEEVQNLLSLVAKIIPEDQVPSGPRNMTVPFATDTRRATPSFL